MYASRLSSAPVLPPRWGRTPVTEGVLKFIECILKTGKGLMILAKAFMICNQDFRHYSKPDLGGVRGSPPYHECGEGGACCGSQCEIETGAIRRGLIAFGKCRAGIRSGLCKGDEQLADAVPGDTDMQRRVHVDRGGINIRLLFAALSGFITISFKGCVYGG